MRARPCLLRFLLWMVAPQALMLAAAGPATAQPTLPGPTLYRLDPCSTLQRGCLDRAICEVPEAIPLLRTFVLTLTRRDSTVDDYGISELSWRDAADGDARGPRLLTAQEAIPADGSPLLELTLAGHTAWGEESIRLRARRI